MKESWYRHGVPAFSANRPPWGAACDGSGGRGAEVKRLTGEIPCSVSNLLRGLDLRKDATGLGPVKDKARRRRAGLRPSLTSPARGGLPAGRSGRRDDRLIIKQRDDDGFFRVVGHSSAIPSS